MKKELLLAALLWSVATAAALGAETVRVVATLPVYASIAESVGGDRVSVAAISRGDEDAHFVKPKPSFALLLRNADLFITTGLDLELWAPTLVDKSGNRAIRDGQPGFVNASQDVPMLDVPASVDRSAGDIHIFGNPHLFTSPLNAKIVAANIAAGLTRVDPAGRAVYEANLIAFDRRIDERLYGPELPQLLGSETLDALARQGRLISWLGEHSLEGRPMLERLGGWLGRALPMRGREIVAYHKNWVYFSALFGLEVVDFVEPKPGIPPSAKHVFELIERIRRDRIQVLLAASYFSPQQVAAIAERTGCVAVRVPMGPGGGGPRDYFELVDLWIDRLLAAFDRQAD